MVEEDSSLIDSQEARVSNDAFDFDSSLSSSNFSSNSESIFVDKVIDDLLNEEKSQPHVETLKATPSRVKKVVMKIAPFWLPIRALTILTPLMQLECLAN